MSIVVTKANRHDASQLTAVLESRFTRVVRDGVVENLCADAGYAGVEPQKAIEGAGFVPHVRPRGEERDRLARNPQFKGRRWVVEACFPGSLAFENSGALRENRCEPLGRNAPPPLVPGLTDKDRVIVADT